MLKGQRRNTPKLTPRSNADENEVEGVGERQQKLATVFDLERTASIKLQELSEVDSNIPEFCRTTFVRNNYELSGWNDLQSIDYQVTSARRDRSSRQQVQDCRTLNSANRSSHRSHSFKRKTYSSRKSIQNSEKQEVLPFNLTDTQDNTLAISTTLTKPNQTSEFSLGNFVSECIYPLHVFDKSQHTNSLQVSKLQIFNALKKQKVPQGKDPHLAEKRLRPIRPMTSLRLKPQDSVDKVMSGVIRRHHAVRQTLKKKGRGKIQIQSSRKYQGENRLAQYLQQKYDAVLNKLGSIALK